MSKFSDWLVKEGLASPRPSAEPSPSTSKPTVTDAPPSVLARAETLFAPVATEAQKIVSSVESALTHLQKVAPAMSASKITFHRLHKFKENGVAFTPAQIAAATYKVLVGSSGAAQQSYLVPASALAGLAPTAPVTVSFSSIGFTPVPGVTYHVSVVAVLDGVVSDASPDVVFTNPLTPAGVEAVAVS